MPRRTKTKNASIATTSASLPKTSDELIDQFVTGPMTGEAVNAASMAFKKALLERAMGADRGHHLGYVDATGIERPISHPRNRGKTVALEPMSRRNSKRSACSDTGRIERCSH